MHYCLFMIQITKILDGAYLIQGLENGAGNDTKIYLSSLYELQYEIEQQIIRDENR